jgi:hypothetical protein
MLTRIWILLLGGVVLIAAHALILRFALQHKGLSTAVAAGVVILIALTHLGLISPLYALLRRLSRR